MRKYQVATLFRATVMAGVLMLQAGYGFAAGQNATTVKNRITGAVDMLQTSRLQHDIHPLAKRAQDLGLASDAVKMPWMTLFFQMTATQQAALTRLLAAQQDPASPTYHKWLTPEQFGAQFGMSPGDMQTVSSWLRQQGFSINATARGGQWISFAGTAGQVRHTFGTTIHNVSLDGENHIAALSDPVLPTAIANVVSSLHGLDDFRLKPRVRTRQVKPDFTSSVSGNHYFAPGDFYTIYNTNPLLTAGIKGAGVTIAVMGQTDISTSDVAAFRSASGLSTTNLPRTQLFGPDPGSRAADLPEAQLDVEWSGAVAPDASILFVNSTDVIGTSLVQAIDNNLAPIISISYGNCEFNFASIAQLNTLNATFQYANSLGITIVGPSGDSGATDCDGGTDASGSPYTSAIYGLAVDFPASSPYVTAVGGTTFDDGSGSYWSATNGGDGGSATVANIPAKVWNDTNQFQTTNNQGQTVSNGLSSGGGGASQIFAKPTWQIGPGVPNDYARDLPDLSFNASPNHDGYLYCYSGSCTNGYRDAKNNLSVVGGTSASTPSFAGILALVMSKMGGQRIGNANPAIYALANSGSYSTIFHDVTVGNNQSPCAAGTTNCPTGGNIGYTAATGYDLASGWGSLDTTQFVNAFATANTGGLGRQLASNTFLTISSSNPVLSAPVTLTTSTTAATASNGAPSSGSVPAGSVQFVIDGTAFGTPVLLNGSGVATLTTTTIPVGSHQVTSVYQGSSVYATSESSGSIVVGPDFTLSPPTGTLTVSSPGQTSSALPLTFTSSNGFSGTVTVSFASAANASTTSLTNSTYNSANGTYAVSVPANGSITCSLTVGTAAAKAVADPSAPRVQHAGLAGAGRLGWITAAGTMTLAGMLFLVPATRRRAWAPLLALSLLAVLASGLGCGSGIAPTQPGTTTTGTATGSYALSVTATAPSGSTTITQTSNLTLVVN